MPGPPWRGVDEMLAAGTPVVVSLAPSYAGAFPASPGRVVAALKALGFAAVEETASALGEMIRQRAEKAREVSPVLSGSCPAVRQLVVEEFPRLIPHVEPLSALALHVARLRRRYPRARVVFVGPCQAKRSHPDRPAPDAVLTFSEVAGWWRVRGIDPLDFPPVKPDRAAGVIGRISVAVVQASGVEQCRRLLGSIAVPWEGMPYLELAACPGGCLNGPGMPLGDMAERHRRVVRYAREGCR